MYDIYELRNYFPTSLMYHRIGARSIEGMYDVRLSCRKYSWGRICCWWGRFPQGSSNPLHGCGLFGSSFLTSINRTNYSIKVELKLWALKCFWKQDIDRLSSPDQSVSGLMTFFLQMLKNPEVQRRAQTEIDEVVGTDRLPTFDDMDALPYVRGVCSEIFRYILWSKFLRTHILNSGL